MDLAAVPNSTHRVIHTEVGRRASLVRPGLGPASPRRTTGSSEGAGRPRTAEITRDRGQRRVKKVL